MCVDVEQTRCPADVPLFSLDFFNVKPASVGWVCSNIRVTYLAPEDRFVAGRGSREQEHLHDARLGSHKAVNRTCSFSRNAVIGASHSIAP